MFLIKFIIIKLWIFTKFSLKVKNIYQKRKIFTVSIANPSIGTIHQIGLLSSEVAKDLALQTLETSTSPLKRGCVFRRVKSAVTSDAS